MKNKTTYLLLSFFFGILCLAFTQNKQLRAYTLEDGLPQSQVYAIVQDEKGYLWVGTQGGGLARFDGTEFKVFNETHGLASNYISSLVINNNTLYIGSQLGVSVKLKNNRFEHIDLPEVNKLCVVQGNLYALTVNGIFLVNKAFSAEKIKLNSELDDISIKDFMFYDQQYWIASQDGLWRFKSLKDKANTLEKLERNDFTALLGVNQKIFASTFDDGTIIFDSSSFDDQLLLREPLRINSTTLLNSDELWLATDSQGISVLNTESYNDMFFLNSANGLSVPNVRQIFQDRQSNIWIGTSGGGLYKYFQNNFKHFDTETGLNGNRVYAVHHDNNAIWISNSESGLMRIDNFGVHDIDIPQTFSEVKIKTITSDQKGNLWAGSDGRGLLFHGSYIKDSLVVDTLKNRKSKLPKEVFVSKVLNTENGFPYDWIRKIHVDKDAIYAATYSSGIVKFNYNPKTDSLTIKKIYAKVDGIQDLFIKDMVKDPTGRLWYSTQNGHLGYLKNNDITHLGNVLNQSTPINTILFDKNSVFLGTAGKGIWWSRDDEFSNFKKLTGIKKTTSENIYQLIFDNQGYLWVGTERGVDKLELDKDNIIKDAFFFGRNDGFLGMETCLNAVDKDNKGHLWFGALYGLTEYRPMESTQDTKKPELYLEDVKVAYKSLDSLNLGTWTNNDKVLKLPPEQTQISFSYKTIDLDHPNGVEYRYKLNNNEWSPWTTNETQDFAELNFGAYNFMVQSRNYRWKQSDAISFSFYIEPPMYKKPWFQWVIIAMVSLFIAFLVFQYVKRLKRKNAKEKERLKLENHLLSLEQKALRLQMNPHFIFNVLNGIKAMALSKPDKMNKTVNSFATLLRETLVNSRKDLISLDQEISTLKHYIEVEQLMSERSFSYDIVLDSQIDPEELLVPPMLIQPFVENAIRHGILNSPRDGELTLHFKEASNFLHVTIIDNGVGIFKSQEQKQKTDHQSMALTVTKERLESISGKGALKISEIKNEDGTIGGTRISFQLPLETDY
ncbi:ligand-binding sensor domain-containing protein [Psychroserpens sp. BH13MA-6]